MISPETLRRFSLFAGIDPAAFKDLAMAGDEVNLKEGDWLFKEGEDADALYLILSGEVELKINLDEKGARQADLSTLVEGDVTGWSALLEPCAYTLNAVAAADTRVVKLDAAQLRELMDRNTNVGYVLMGRLAQALADRLTNLRVQFVSLIE